AGMVAPRLFDWVAEYPLLIIAAVLCRPGFSLADDREVRIFWGALLAALVLLLLPRFAIGYEFSHSAYGGMVIVLLAIALIFAHNPLRFAGLVALTLTFIHRSEERREGKERTSSDAL